MMLLTTSAAATGDSGPPPVQAGDHRYWRMVVNEPTVYTGYVWMSEMELRAVPNGPAIENSFASRTASEENSNYTFAKAFDGIIGELFSGFYRTNTSSTNFPVYFTFDAGTGLGTQIQQIVIWPHENRLDDAPRKFDVQSSDDGITWTTEWSVDDIQTGNPAPRVYTDPAYAPISASDGWDVNKIAVGHDLSNNDRTITNTSGGSDYRVQTPTAAGAMAGSGELVYAELAMGSDADVEYNGYVGLLGTNNVELNRSANPVFDGMLGRRGTGSFWHTSVEQVSGLAPYGNDDVLMVAFIPNTGEVWTGVNGVWDHDPDSDPATITYPFWDGSQVFLSANVRDTGNAVTLQLESTDWTYSPPVGAVALTEVPDINPRGDIARVYTLTAPRPNERLSADRGRVLVVMEGF